MERDCLSQAGMEQTARRLARGLLSIARTRFQLLFVEFQEERERCRTRSSN